MLLERILGHTRQQFATTVTDTLVKIGMQIAAESTVFLIDSTDLIVNHELLVETVAFRSLVISMHEIVDRDGLGAVLLANPVGIRQVDTDRRSRIAIAGKDSSRDHFRGHSLNLLFLVFRVGRRVVFEPLSIVRNELRTLGSCQVFEINHRLPCTGDT